MLTTTIEVIEALGGTKAVAAITGRTYAATFNWRSWPSFPSNTYVALQRALNDKGFVAPHILWGMSPIIEHGDSPITAAAPPYGQF